MIQVNVHEAKTRLSELMVAARRGERVVIARAGKPESVLTPINDDAERAERAAKMEAYIGSGKGLFGPNVGEFLMEPLDDETMAEIEAPLFPVNR